MNEKGVVVPSAKRQYDFNPLCRVHYIMCQQDFLDYKHLRSLLFLLLRYKEDVGEK